MQPGRRSSAWAREHCPQPYDQPGDLGSKHGLKPELLSGLKHEAGHHDQSGRQESGIRILVAEDSVVIQKLLLTLLQKRGHQSVYIEAGMDGYLSKPIRPAELFETTERFVPATRKTAVEIYSTGTKTTTDLGATQ